MPLPAPASASEGTPRRFASNHPWDRNFHLVLLALAWLGILMDFGGSIASHVAKARPPYPWIVHVHGVVFTGWLVLFTVQVLLVRWGNLPAHRRLGMAMAGVAVAMLLLGPATALHTKHLKQDLPGADPAFLSVQFTDLIAFAGLIAAGLMRRKDATSHRRLMMLGTLYITDAGFARWLGDALFTYVGDNVWGLWAAAYAHTTVLMLSLGVYDLITRRRLHPAWVIGILWVGANQAIAIGLYEAPWWGEFAKRLIAAFP